MNLTEEQQELLHAWVDGETTDAEEQIANELLQEGATQNDAQEYIAELRQLRELLAAHGGVEMPAGLRDRVRAALDDETAHDNVITTPFFFRRWALAAVAAAIVMSLALVYGPTLVSPPVDHAGDVASANGGESGRAIQPVQSPEDEGGVADQSPHTDALERGDGKDNREWSGPGKNSEGQGATAGPKPPLVPAGEAHEQDLERVQQEREGKGRVSVLNLDRGAGTPFEISVRMARKTDAPTLLAYNDLLLVCNLYGDAYLKEGVEASNGGDFSGHDFSSFDGVEVEVHETRVEDLLAAVDRLADVQSYGEVIMPQDLRAAIDTRVELVDEVQEMTASLQRDRLEDEPDRTTRRAPVYDNERPHGYLPPEVQDAHLRRLARDNDTRRDELAALENRIRKHTRSEPESSADAEAMPENSRKLRLIIRLR